VSAGVSVTPGDVRAARERLSSDAEGVGYHLNPDTARTERIVKGLLANEARYGYRSCPCRLAVGEAARDRDIVCPCDYRDADLDEWDSCFCGLYVTAEVARGEKKASPVPERRPAAGADVPAVRPPEQPSGGPTAAVAPKVPAWRCRVCGYLCAREGPPAVCPICKASRDRFERYL
jgi:ferredoxin-thioredoxin reductase catalytic chain